MEYVEVKTDGKWKKVKRTPNNQSVIDQLVASGVLKLKDIRFPEDKKRGYRSGD